MSVERDWTDAHRTQRVADATRSGELARHEAEQRAWGDEVARDAGRCALGICPTECEDVEGHR